MDNTSAAYLIFVVYPLQLPDVQVPFPFELLHLQLQVGVLLLEGVLPQLQYLVALVVLLDGEGGIAADHRVRL